MKEELLKIASESLSSDEVSEIVKEKFMNALGGAIEDAFRWGDAKHAIEETVKEEIEKYINENREEFAKEIRKQLQSTNFKPETQS